MKDRNGTARGQRVAMAALLEVLKPLDASSRATTDRKRRLIANLCRMVGQEMNGSAIGHPIAGGNRRELPTAPRVSQTTVPTNGNHAEVNPRLANEDGVAPGRIPAGATTRRNGCDDSSGAGLESAAPADPLSPRLRQTLRLLLAGESEKQVAQRLALSPHTVHVYVKKLYKLYGVSSRGELLAKWVQPK
jgi:DNA-binding CsgD family transcriptional regulator